MDPLPDERWYCPDCGNLNDSSERFCKSCGKVR
ncbi:MULTISPECIES: zinc ribbon domain-containing protein [Bacillota]